MNKKTIFLFAILLFGFHGTILSILVFGQPRERYALVQFPKECENIFGKIIDVDYENEKILVELRTGEKGWYDRVLVRPVRWPNLICFPAVMRAKL